MKPGFIAVAAYKSPMILSKVPAAGKYAKNEGCCQCVTPGMIKSWKSFAISSIFSPLVGGAAEPGKLTLRTNPGRGTVLTRQCLAKIAWFHTGLDRLVLDRIVMIADAVYSLITSCAEPKTEEFI